MNHDQELFVALGTTGGLAGNSSRRQQVTVPAFRAEDGYGHGISIPVDARTQVCNSSRNLRGLTPPGDAKSLPETRALFSKPVSQVRCILATGARDRQSISAPFAHDPPGSLGEGWQPHWPGSPSHLVPGQSRTVDRTIARRGLGNVRSVRKSRPIGCCPDARPQGNWVIIQAN